MKVLVDTSVWSLALRRRKTLPPVAEVSLLKELIENQEEIITLGIILQELLQGIRDPQQYRSIFKAMRPFPLLEPNREDYEYAAHLSNLCRSKGIQASTIDFLISAVCLNHKSVLLMTDKDFLHISKYCDLKLLGKS